MKNTLAVLLLSLGLVSAPCAFAQLSVAPSDSVETVLAAQKGKRITLRLRSGQETTGTVTSVSAKLVHVSAVVGKEFFDAVIPLDAIEAVFIRTRN